jgi:hypothetical protein
LSEEGGYWIKLFERFFGVIIILVGGLSMYYVLTSLQAFRIFGAFFVFLNLLLVLLGLVLLTAKTE